MLRSPKAIRHLPQAKQNQIRRKAIYMSKVVWIWLAISALIMIGFLVCFIFALDFSFDYYLLFIMNIFGLINFWVLCYFVKRNLVLALLMSDIRPPYCAGCEYDLRATHGNKCPECGAQLAPEQLD